jgi:predicted nucleotidyltransferase
LVVQKNMDKIKLPNVTLLGIDCVNIERLVSAMDVSESGIEFGAVKLLTSLPTEDKRKVEIPHIGSIEEFSRFCIEDLHKYVDTDYVLLVQYDGFILNPESWTDEFLKYNYIGAPWFVAEWSVRDFGFPVDLLGTLIVGNGGFSLRSKKFLETSARLAQEGRIPKMNPEDVAMCVWYRSEFEKEGIKFAPPEIASQFSIEGTDHTYNKQFGFHGFTWTDIDVWIQEHPEYPVIVDTFNKAKISRFHSSLVLERDHKVNAIRKVFESVAVEAHVLGSVARRDSDPYSDLDIWITIADKDFDSVKEKRIELYKQVGQVVHICEPHQNAPINGLFSTVIYKTSKRLLIIDYYLCPQSSAFITNESKNLFGSIELPSGELGLSPQKVTVDTSYRIDFFICFIFNSIKKIVRKNDNPLESLFKEYSYLREKYGIEVKELQNTEHTFNHLLQVSENIKEVAKEKQKQAIIEIENFAKLVEENS